MHQKSLKALFHTPLQLLITLQLSHKVESGSLKNRSLHCWCQAAGWRLLPIADKSRQLSLAEKSHIDLFQAVPGSTSGLHLYTTNWPVSWQLRFFVVSLSLFQSFVSFPQTTCISVDWPFSQYYIYKFFIHLVNDFINTSILSSKENSSRGSSSHASKVDVIGGNRK